MRAHGKQDDGVVWELDFAWSRSHTSFMIARSEPLRDVGTASRFVTSVIYIKTHERREAVVKSRCWKAACMKYRTHLRRDTDMLLARRIQRLSIILSLALFLAIVLNQGISHLVKASGYQHDEWPVLCLCKSDGGIVSFEGCLCTYLHR